MANPTRRELTRLWRKATGEKHTDVVTDLDIYELLQAGLEAFNDTVHYFETDDTSVTLTGGTQEYDLPSDCIEVRWVRWNGRFLAEEDESQMRRREEDYVAADASEPARFYLRGRKIGLVPTPSAAAVSQAGTLTIRQVATPTDIAINATVAQLATMHRRIPVYYAVAEWYAGLGSNAEKFATHLKLFEVRAAAAAAAYKARMQKK